MSDYKELVGELAKRSKNPTALKKLGFDFIENIDEEKKEIVFKLELTTEEFGAEKGFCGMKELFMYEKLESKEGFDFNSFYKECEQRAYTRFLDKIIELTCIGIETQF